LGWSVSTWVPVAPQARWRAWHKPQRRQALNPCGRVLQLKHLIYPDTEEGRVAMEMLRLPY